LRFGNVVFSVAEIHRETPGLGSEIPTASVFSSPTTDAVLAGLSDARRRVLDLLLQGFPEKKVAATLNLSPTTVHNHITAIHRAFKVHSRSDLLVLLLATKGDANATLPPGSTPPGK